MFSWKKRSVSASLERLSAIREEDIETLRARFSDRELAGVPNHFARYIPLLYQAPISAAGIDDGLPYVTLKNGRTFFGHFPAENQRKQYRYVEDKLPSVLTEDTFLLALDVAYRYLRRRPWPPEELQPPDGGFMIECGAYMGHKTIAFAEAFFPTGGHIVAVEILPENAAILKRNVEANNMQDRISVYSYGLWSENRSLRIYSSNRQRNSLVDIGRLDRSQREVQVRRIESILDESKFRGTALDLIYVTVNGAEYETLVGVGDYWSRLKGAYVVCGYKVEGESAHEKCRDLLIEKGFDFLEKDSIRPNARKIALRAFRS